MVDTNLQDGLRTWPAHGPMHAGYIIGRGVRVVEWNVAEHPDKPDGDLASMKLRALTPDGIRMAIAKEHGLSNYREVMLPLTQQQMEPI